MGVLIAYLTDGVLGSSFIGITFPSLSFGAAMLKVARSDAAIKNKASLLKCRPGQIL